MAKTKKKPVYDFSIPITLLAFLDKKEKLVVIDVVGKFTLVGDSYFPNPITFSILSVDGKKEFENVREEVTGHINKFWKENPKLIKNMVIKEIQVFALECAKKNLRDTNE